MGTPRLVRGSVHNVARAAAVGATAAGLAAELSVPDCRDGSGAGTADKSSEVELDPPDRAGRPPLGVAPRSSEVELDCAAGRVGGGGPGRFNDVAEPGALGPAVGASRFSEVSVLREGCHPVAEPDCCAAGTACGASRSSEVERSSDDGAAARVGAELVVGGIAGRLAAGGAGLGAAGRVAAGGVRGLFDPAAFACALARPATKSAIGEWAARAGRERRRRNCRSVRLTARSGAE